jgi:26S proteasome regulatory subunit T1
MPSATGQSWEKYKKEFVDDEEPEKKITPLTDEYVKSWFPYIIYLHDQSLTFPRDIQVLKTYGAAPYAAALKRLEKQIKEKQTSVNEKIGVKVIIIATNHALRVS